MWRVVRLKMSFTTSVQGTVVIPDTRAQILIFSGQDGEGKSKRNVAIADLDKGTIENLDDMQLAAGCIVNENAVFNGKIYTYIFDGYYSRTMLSWDPVTRQWDSVAQS